MPQIIIDVPEECKSLMEPLTELLETMARLASPRRRAGSFAEVERTVAESVAAVERGALAVALSALDEMGERVRCGGKVFKRLEKVGTTFYSRAGEVKVERWLYRQEGVHNGETLDVVAARAGVVGDGWLPQTARAIAHALQATTAREASSLAEELQRLPYSRCSFERVGKLVGEAYAKLHEDIEGELMERFEVPREARSVSVSLDRTSVPMEEIRIDRAAAEHVERVFRQGYCGTVTLHDAKGEALHTLRYGRMPGGDVAGMVSAMREDLWGLIGKRPRLEVIPLADGAPEMWNLLDEVTLGVPIELGLIDFWHVIEKLGAAAKAALGERSGRDTTAKWKLLLLNDSSAATQILGQLRPYAGHKPVDEAITYLENNADRMDYASARAAGLPIGSGNVEATCKSLVHQRMSRSGSRWKQRSGDHVLHLRQLAQSDRWDLGIDLTLKDFRHDVRKVA